MELASGEVRETHVPVVVSKGSDQLPPLMNCGDRAVWDDVTMAIADAVRSGLTVARVPIPAWLTMFRPGSPFLRDWLNRLQSDVTVIQIELSDDEAQGLTEGYAEKEGQRLIEMGRDMLHRRTGGGTLHSALGAYSKWIGEKYVTTPDKRPTAWGAAQVQQVAFLTRHLPNSPLGEMDSQRVEELIEVLRLRPRTDDGKSISVSWARNCIKQFRHFLRWLNKSKQFSWKRPGDLEFGQVRIALTAQETSALARSAQVETYTLAELRTCWEYAEPFQRLLMLLGLNCGFGRSEAASLETNEVHLRQKHPHHPERDGLGTPDDGWILRVRHKTVVYGEWKLWPETIDALEWWLRQRTLIAVEPEVTTVLVTR